jgi:glycosyltransferase involved in cell wall biosynthesis
VNAPVAIAHDYLTQCGGAERVVLDMVRAFPDAPVYTTLYDRNGTFPEFADVDIRVTPLNKLSVLRRHHRLALPVLAPTVARLRVNADVVLASSSGWAHGVQTAGRKVVYCHAPARWLYQTQRYLGRPSDLGTGLQDSARRALAAAAVKIFGAPLRTWDRRAAQSADQYLANSTITRNAIRDIYGIDAEIVPPPPAILPDGPETPYPGQHPGFLLCVARLLPYKNVDVVVRAVQLTPEQRLVVVGDGTERLRLERLTTARGRVTFAGRVSDEHLRWLYHNCSALVAASYEDYGLSPLEAAAFGRPSVVLRAGGYLDTVVENITGVFFDRVDPRVLADALESAGRHRWNTSALVRHANAFSAASFAQRLRSALSSGPGC